MITEIIGALRAGQELKDPAVWKNRQNVTNAVAGVLAGILVVVRLVGVELPITDEQLSAVAEAAAVILGVVNLFLTTATSKKVGV